MYFVTSLDVETCTGIPKNFTDSRLKLFVSVIGVSRMVTHGIYLPISNDQFYRLCCCI